MFKRVLVYVAIASVLFYWLNQQKFSAPMIFKNWQTVELVWAAKKGDINKMDQLIEAGADVNYVGQFSFTPLTWLLTMVKPSPDAKSGFKHLLANGAKPSALLPMSSQTALHFAAGFEDSDYLKLILEHDNNVDINDNRFSFTPLMESISILDSTYKNFNLLLDNGANVNAQSNAGRTTLDHASGNGTWRYALELLKRGADYTEGSGNITPGNPEGLPKIVRTIENLRYWPSAAISANGTDYREKVVEFLRSEGVEVYPWYPEEDPRHNPSPYAILSDEEVNNLWDYCYQLNLSKENNLRLKAFNDINLYKDLSPNNFSIESENVFGLAVINLKKYLKDSQPAVITAEFYGRDQDKYSHYFFNDNNLQCVLSQQDIYNTFKTDPQSQIATTKVEAYVTFKKTCYKRDSSSNFQRLDSKSCDNFRTDAQTYLEFQN